MILVDSSVLIDWLRGRVEPHRQMEPWIRSQQACSCGVVRAEVLRGVVNPRQKDRVSRFFDVLPEIHCDSRLWQEAAELAWTLDRQGKILPLTDVIIAVCALRVAAIVITTDSHFSLIPELESRADLPPFGADGR